MVRSPGQWQPWMGWWSREQRRVAWRRCVGMALVGMVAIALSGCQVYREQQPGTQLVISALSDPKTFNAPLSQESPNVFSFIYEGLVSENGITSEIEPGLAESWEISDDGLQLVFTLREGLRWSDGEPLTAQDVDFTLNQIYFNEAIPTPTRDVLRIGETGALPTVRALDDRRVEFQLPEPFAPILRALQFEILPEHILKPTLETTDSTGKPAFLNTWGIDTPPEQIVSNGPYRLKSYLTGQRVVFERNPYYWDKDEQGQTKPHIDRFIWQIVESQDTALLQFRSGSLDALVPVTPDYFSLLKREENRGNFQLYLGGPSSSTSFITFNLNQGQRDGKPLVSPEKSAWFNNPEFRRAVAMAIDREAMIANVYQGLGTLQNSPLSVQSPYYLSPEEGLPVYRYEPDQAKARLEAAGFRYNAAGVLEDSAGNPVRFTLNTNAGNKIRESMAAQIKRDLAGIGIQVDLQMIAFSTLVDKLDGSLDWECILLGLTGGVEPNNGANVWRVNGRLHMFNQMPGPGQPPLTGRTVADWEEEIAALYVRGAQTIDEAQRKEIYAQTQILTQEYLPFIYLVNSTSMSAARNWLEGVEYSALGGLFWNLPDLQIAAERTTAEAIAE